MIAIKKVIFFIFFDFFRFGIVYNVIVYSLLRVLSN
jgi:hypothetical protein